MLAWLVCWIVWGASYVNEGGGDDDACAELFCRYADETALREAREARHEYGCEGCEAAGHEDDKEESDAERLVVFAVYPLTRWGCC